MPIPQPLKWVLWVVGTLAGLFLAVTILFGWLMSGLVGEPNNDEVARVISPNGAFDAVLFETNGGATSHLVTTFMSLNMVRRQRTLPLFHSMAPFGIKAHTAPISNGWHPDLVAVEYLSAKSSKIKMPVVSVRNQAIRLVARDGVADNTAPSGGMLYNLRGRQ